MRDQGKGIGVRGMKVVGSLPAVRGTEVGLVEVGVEVEVEVEAEG